MKRNYIIFLGLVGIMFCLLGLATMSDLFIYPLMLVQLGIIYLSNKK